MIYEIQDKNFLPFASICHGQDVCIIPSVCDRLAIENPEKAPFYVVKIEDYYSSETGFIAHHDAMTIQMENVK